MAYGNYAPFYRNGYFNPVQIPMQPIYQPMQDVGNQFASQYQSNVQPTSQPQNDMLWVLNENEATAYPVAPNNSVVLWDKSTPTIYIKSVDGSGMPSMRTLDFKERTPSSHTTEEHRCSCGDKFVTIESFLSFQQEFEDMKRIVERLKTNNCNKTEVASDE